MILDTQIKLIVFSFIFGFIYSFFIGFNYNLIYNQNKFIKISSSFLCIVVGVLAYFIMINKVASGILHIYSLLLVTIGFISEAWISKIIVSKNKK